MIELNVKFLELYKSIDRICKDMFSSSEGISTYIIKMEETPLLNRKKVQAWDDDYKQLKHYRYMRNQLAHDLPIDSDFCAQEDIDWLEYFYNDLLSCNDPIAIAYKIESTNISKIYKNEDEIIKSEDNNNIIEENKKSMSIWNKFIKKIKSWFS